jgi:hypothetical protein
MYIYSYADIVNRAAEPNLFELLFPHLFPYGTGGSNTVPGSEAFHHWCNTFVNAYSPDRRYKRSARFLFAIFGEIQACDINISCHIMKKTATCKTLLENIGGISPDDVDTMIVDLSKKT